jgi:hypothetical protein
MYVYSRNQQTMIFRDKQNGTLLNVRRDDFTNDRKYFQEIIRIAGEGLGGTVGNTTTPRYICPFEDFINNLGVEGGKGK